MAGCLLNPLVYAWHNDNFRAHIKVSYPTSVIHTQSPIQNLFLSKRSSSFKTIVTNASRIDNTHSRIDAGPLNTTTLLDALDKDDVKL